nr:glutamine--fructose-6-phosphate aminotransferase [isomerizing] 2 [Ipomoea trifida]
MFDRVFEEQFSENDHNEGSEKSSVYISVVDQEAVLETSTVNTHDKIKINETHEENGWKVSLAAVVVKSLIDASFGNGTDLNIVISSLILDVFVGCSALDMYSKTCIKELANKAMASKEENCFLRFGSVNDGETTPSNSHPQISGAGNDFLVVHNSVIINYGALKETPIRLDFTFESETDTEVIPKLTKFVFDKAKEGEVMAKSQKAEKDNTPKE